MVQRSQVLDIIATEPVPAAVHPQPTQEHVVEGELAGRRAPIRLVNKRDPQAFPKAVLHLVLTSASCEWWGNVLMMLDGGDVRPDIIGK